MFDHGSWMYGGWLVMLLVWVAPFVVLFLAWQAFARNKPPSARDFLDQTYARGELSRDEYLKKRDDLAGR